MMKLTVAFNNIALAPKNVSEEEEHTQFHCEVPRPVDVLEWKRNLVAHGDAREEK